MNRELQHKEFLEDVFERLLNVQEIAYYAETGFGDGSYARDYLVEIDMLCRNILDNLKDRIKETENATT